MTLSADNKNAKQQFQLRTRYHYFRCSEGVTVTVDNQTIDTSKLTTQTGTVTLTFTTD